MSLAYKELENIPMMQRFKLNDLFSHGENESNMSYCDYLVSDLRQIGGFHWVLRFPPPIKLTAMI